MIKSSGSRFAGVFATLCGLALLLSTPAVAADPVVNPGSGFGAIVTGGEIKIGNKLEPIDVGAMSPSPRLRNLTVNADGSFTAAANDFVFPQLTLPVDSPVGKVDIFVQIRAASPVSGSIDPATGEVSLNTSLTIQLTSNHGIVALGSNCYVGTPASPIPFAMIGGATKGVPYDENLGTTTLVDDVLAIPAASGCPTIVGQNVNDVVNNEMGLPSASGQNKVTLTLRFNPAPHSENWVDPNGPGHIDPVIVNDTEFDTGITQRSWLESAAISDGTKSGSTGNVVRLSLLVNHNPGRKVTKLRIDDDWNDSDDAEFGREVDVVAEQPEIVGGFNYSRVTLEYEAPTAGMNLECPGFLAGDGDLTRDTQISVAAVLDDGSVSASSVSGIRLTREDCNGKIDPPMAYGWEPADPSGAIHPGDPVTFKFRIDDTDSLPTANNQSGGYNWRLRNLDSGQVIDGTKVCHGDNQDNAVQSLTVNPPTRGRWVAEGQLRNLASDCGRVEASGRWYWFGAVDVNSPAESAGILSPEVNLSSPARPAQDGLIDLTITSARDLRDQTNGGGLVQALEWDLDGNPDNGYEKARLGDSRTGLTSAQLVEPIDTSNYEPGVYTVRVRAGDNGALGAADNARRTNIATAEFMVNTPPVTEDLAVQVDQDKSVPTPLVASDTNADGSHDSLSWTLTKAPANGFLSGEWPNRIYHPEAGFHGTDSFEFEVNDGHGGSATGTVSITVKKTNGPIDQPEPPDPGPEKQALKATFEEGRINLNESSGPGTSGVKIVDSTVPDPPVTFDTKHWNAATGEILAPPNDLVIPPKTVSLSITDPLPLDLDVTIEFAATGNIGGSFNSSTGAMLLDFDARALITVRATEPLGEVLKCDVTPIPLQLSTGGGDLIDPGNGGDRPAATWKSKAFADAQGAVTSLWSDLPTSTPLAEPMAPLATCNATLDGLIGGKGGFWLGGKVTFDGGPSNPGPGTNPKPGEGIFDGKRLHIRLKCPARFKPSCKTNSAPMTKKKKGKPMSKPVKQKIKAGKWKVVSYLIKPKFRATVKKMAGKNRKLLVVRQKVKSKKVGRKKFRGKPHLVFHKYKVRTG